MGKNIVKPRRNEIYMAKLPVNGTSVQRGRRPVLIVQNDVGNRYSSTTIIIPMTGRTKKAAEQLAAYRGILKIRKS